MSSAPHPFHPARVVRKEDAGGGLTLLTLLPQADARRSYALPGQYVSLRAGSHSSFFVLAGDVGAVEWQVLIRPGAAAADGVIAVEPGAEVETTQALGGGFPVGEAKGRILLGAATGSGIAALRPVIRHRIATGESARTGLFLGIRTKAETPLVGELARWRADGVNVVACLSREAAASATDFVEGYVQDAVRRAVESGRVKLDGGMIFAAGVKGMIAGMRRLADSLGVAESDIRTNY